jgi:P-loop containing NTP hydrolase pore-1/C-terminal domain on Strawberry notch homologue
MSTRSIEGVTMHTIHQMTAVQKAAKIHQASTSIAAILPNKIDRADLDRAMTQAFGTTSDGGQWTQRDSFEMLEHALTIHLTRKAQRSEDRHETILASLPTQTVRSETQIEFQQFSTPLGLAAIMQEASAIRPTDILLEPSAGTGLLIAGLPVSPSSIFMNEREPLRAALLQFAFPGAIITTHDATYVNVMIKTRPTVVLMNPPFSRNGDHHHDPLTASKHLDAALKLAQNGARVVAIMPEHFHEFGRTDTYNRITAAHRVLANCPITNGFTKQGTSTGTRLVVIDKLPPTQQAPIVDQTTLLAELPPRADQSARVTPKPTTVFSGFSRKATTAPAKIEDKPAIVVRDVEYTALTEPNFSNDQAGIYLAYQPTRTAIQMAGSHPTPLVESLAMGSIAMHIPSYLPKLPGEIVAKRVLSAAQLETLIYAGDAHTHYLPGRYRVSEDRANLIPSDTGNQYRQGFFLGDGTGAGKGRQVAAIIMDQWVRGKRKHIWISENNTLLEDAQRDWTALGGLAPDIQPLAKWKPHEQVTMKEGILFLSYPGLRSKTGERPRLDQIIEYAGDDFDGILIFDESHAMGNAAGKKTEFREEAASQQGIAGVRLQNILPEARVVYSSATGASNIENLSYALRLGLWGEDTAFANREQFISEITAGGIAALELIARELKGLGLYCARSLSYAGVEYDVLEQQLSPEQIETFNIYADAWAIIHQNLNAALEEINVISSVNGATLNGQALGAARSRFESTKQRFFGALLLSMKLPALIPAMQKALDDDMSCVVQLVTTAEATLDRRLAALNDEDRAELSIDLSPIEHMLDYLNNAFPVRQMEVHRDETGESYSEPMWDADGNPVFNPQAMEMRERCIEHLCAMPAINTALDALLNHFGPDQMAEVTGRTRRLITLENGDQKIEARSARTNLVETDHFMQGRKRILVFSDAGGTGRSYHASLTHTNQQRRVHFLLEPGWRADKAIQGLGRTNRTNQASAPIFRPVTTDCCGERRFISTIARRLDSLGAITRGQRQAGGQNLFDPADNLESDFAKEALNSWFHLLYNGKLQSITLADFEHISGLKLTDGSSLKDDLPPIQRFLNRILAMRIELQNAIFDEFTGLMESRIDAARAAGTLDLGVETIHADRLDIIDDTVLRTDSKTGATSNLLTIKAEWKRWFLPLENVLTLIRSSGHVRTMQNQRSKRVAAIRPSYIYTDEDGKAHRQFKMTTPTGDERISEIALEESTWADIDPHTFERGWTEQCEELSTMIDAETIYIATGQILPIWNLLDKEHVSIRRITTVDGRSLLGRLVPKHSLDALYTATGIDKTNHMTPAEIAQYVMSGNRYTLPIALKIQAKRSLVNGHHRLEILNLPPQRLIEFKTMGCFTEIIQFKTRLFVPSGKEVSILTTILSRTY